MALYNSAGNLIEGTEGRVLQIERQFTYRGDGCGHYWLRALVANEDGTFGYRECGAGVENWISTEPDPKGSTVDGAHLLPQYRAWKEAEEEKRRREEYNEVLSRQVKKGALAYVLKGKRGRKNEGRWGHIFWLGIDKFRNPKVGIIDGENGERFFVVEDYVEVIPELDESFV